MKKLNLAKVRSAGIALTIALSLCLVVAPGASAATSESWVTVGKLGPGQSAVVLDFVPATTTVAELAGAGFSPGLMSAGLGTVSASQTYLDIGAGNRVFNSLYDHELPPAPAAPWRCRAWFAEAVAVVIEGLTSRI